MNFAKAHLLILLLLPITDAAITFTGGEKTVTALQGDTVTLTWTYTDPTSDAGSALFATFFPRTSRNPADTQSLAKVFISNNNPNDVTPPASYTGRVEVQKGTGSVSLKITNVSLNDDNKYLCAMSHILGTVNGPAINLVVEAPPAITMETTKTCTAGDTGCSLTCTVTGKPEPTITWLRNGQNIGTQKRYDFSLVKKEDKGTYTCRAQNKHGTKNKDIELVVRYFEFDTDASDTSVKTWNGRETKITCVAEGVPTPTFEWKNPDGNIISTGLGVLTFTPQQSNDYGTYQCTAKNDVNSLTHSIQVVQIFSPGEPVVTEAVPTAHAIKVSWNEPSSDGGSPITKYSVNISVVGKSDWKEHMITDPSTRTYSIVGLERNTSYRLRMFAWNMVGKGAESIKKLVDTLNQGPPDSPVILNTQTSLSSNKFTLRWGKPSNGGSAITKYEIQYRNIENSEWNTKEIVGSDTLFAEIELAWEATFDVKVFAHNALGRSSESTGSMKQFIVAKNDPNTGARTEDDGDTILIVIVILVIFLIIAIPLLVFLLWKKRKQQPKRRSGAVEQGSTEAPLDEGYASRGRPDGDINRNQPDEDAGYAALNKPRSRSPIPPEAQYAIVDTKAKKKKKKKKDELVYADLADMTPTEESPGIGNKNETTYADIVHGRPKKEADYANAPVRVRRPKPENPETTYANVTDFI